MNATDFALIAEGVLWRGTSIAFTGMLIVVSALLLIIGFISALPRVLAVLEKHFPEADDHHAPQKSHPESQVADEEAILAAIGYALHTRMKSSK